MLIYVLRRILISIPVVLIASFLLFWFVRETFDPTARLRNVRDPAVIARETERLGLNDPVPVQYTKWLGDFVQGDWGESARTRQPVTGMVRPALWNTIQLIFFGVIVSATLAVAIGVFGALKQYSLPDYVLTGFSYLAIAMPPFWFGLLAINVFAFRIPEWAIKNDISFLGLDKRQVDFVNLHRARAKETLSGAEYAEDYIRHLILPVMTLSVQIVGAWSRYQRSAMLDVMSADYIRTARAKGVPRRKVVFKHGVRNALIPLVTVMAIDIGLLFGGLLVTETIFSIPGMGRMFVQALLQGDIAVLEAWMVVVAIFVIAFNLLADILYSILDPRIRLS
ncbi:ABC transporter permease [Iamia sp. SCSIO 61187]|uniref:ABC transporter permease n=1 Tax=Iamia sp. SCSIO 61187 TaxID=2722752 RepID=UPI001C627A3F|nr:ABC transporter permease [Iamia sp. SCSIO 61187]QYG93262.1 ABC transporter permease [Iamia sp. SCSIO 61187]